ncbi:hypothetical protein CKM354_001290900 [Cercospora kikuchii]|uniref:Uncharacterized protein n=1 Tax=Cercospora kikuchii TaxID=84275 RepID=A0A9P3FMX8_9PEZI|nr:uncharacterized protein CKM354_001290900 [Cercospora kikuchii]GIZ49892.1 hypothetical protein CKM354_001290900 [Cercospora kikuchii]
MGRKQPYSFINPNGTIGCSILNSESALREECVLEITVYKSRSSAPKAPGCTILRIDESLMEECIDGLQVYKSRSSAPKAPGCVVL